MARNVGVFRVAQALCSRPEIIRAKPSVNWFLCQYLRKFRVIDVGGNLIIHSHLPPLNSNAYKRFIREHLVDQTVKPSHAQIGVTHACPQHCDYCYNKERRGDLMDTETVVRTIRDLKDQGVFWIGLTGGEPLLNKDLVEIVEAIGDDCSSKIFTTGCGLTEALARDLSSAGLDYVTISLDHWKEEVHDGIRNYRGAYKIALRAIDTFKRIGNIHVGVSAVLSKQMIENREVEEFLGFLRRMEVHEAWLSETKPSVRSSWDEGSQISEEDRIYLVELQDRLNRAGGMTVNYLGHFEDAKHFGCTAGHKMIYVDPFGEVSPCVFIPLTFGNVQRRPIRDIVNRMQTLFPSESRCFINTKYPVIRKHFKGRAPISEQGSQNVLDEVKFGPLAKFFQLQYR